MNIKPYTHFLFLPLVLVLLTAIMLAFPIGRDWPTWNVSTWEQLKAPYDMPNFTGMPFAFFALPHALLPINIGNAINLALNILVIAAVAYRYAGVRWHIALAITMTTPFFIDLLMSNNVDWIPLSAFLVADWAAYPLLAMKPQMLAGMAIIRFKANPQPLHLLPLVVVLIASVAIWGAWWKHLGVGLAGSPWNFAPWPYFIPIGIYLLWLAWQRDDEIIAACATPFLVPYFAIYSVAGLHILLACRYRRAALWMWVVTWWYFIITTRWLAAI